MTENHSTEATASNLFFFKVISVSMVFGCTMIGGLIPLKIKSGPQQERILSILNAMSGGVFIGAGLLHMLPDAVTGFEKLTNYPLGYFFCICGFFLVLFAEKIIQHQHQHAPNHEKDEEISTDEPDLDHSDKNKHDRNNRNTSFHQHALPSNDRPLLPFILTMVLSIHSFLAGAALGIQPTKAETWVTLTAIITHKWVESISLGVSFVKAGLTKDKILKFLLAFSLMTPLGVMIGMSLMNTGDTFGSFISFMLEALAAGTFLYITLSVIAEEFVSNDIGLKFWAMCGGFVLMAIVAIWA